MDTRKPEYGDPDTGWPNGGPLTLVDWVMGTLLIGLACFWWVIPLLVIWMNP